LYSVGVEPAIEIIIIIVVVRRERQRLRAGIHTTRVPGPRTPVSNTGVILDTRVYGPCSRAPVHTTRGHGPDPHVEAMFRGRGSGGPL